MNAFFLDAPDGSQRFCIHHPAQGSVKRGQVLYLHPFAEEMNKSRRMAALLSRALAGCGFEVLQIDLLGCGDSAGDFGDATWSAWVNDALMGVRWLQSQPDTAPLWLCGLRAGCLVASEALGRLGTPANLLLMQPPASGKPLLQQFLRLKLAADMAEGPNKGAMAELRAAIARGEALEIAGYRLAAVLASGLEAATLTPPETEQPGRLIWLELNANVDAEWTLVSSQTQQRWQDAGWQVNAQQLTGPTFWLTTEIEEAPNLLDAALRLINGEAESGWQRPVAEVAP